MLGQNDVEFDFMIVKFSLILIDEISAQTDYFAPRKMTVPFSMAIRNVELMQESFPKHSCIVGTARMK